MNIDAGKQLDEAHEKFSALYTKMRNEILDEGLKENLEKCHDSWMGYVYSEVKLISEFYDGGSAKSMFVCFRWAELIEARIDDLKKLCEQLDIVYE
jgi:uncharacterized protein YecT (DUF1311 family)